MVSVTKVDVVQVVVENLLLRVHPLDLKGQEGLLQLPAEGLLVGEEERPSQLHGDRAGPLGDAAVVEVFDDSAEDSDKVDSPMGVEAGVLHGDEGLLDDLGHLLRGENDPFLQVILPDDPTLIVVNIGNH